MPVVMMAERKGLDAGRIEGGLQALGLLYGSLQALREIVADAPDEAGAIRQYLMQRRPHLLSCYDLNELVAMVLAAGERAHDGPAGIERFDPR